MYPFFSSYFSASLPFSLMYVYISSVAIFCIGSGADIPFLFIYLMGIKWLRLLYYVFMYVVRKCVCVYKHIPQDLGDIPLSFMAVFT